MTKIIVRYEGKPLEIAVTLTPDTMVLSPVQEVDLPALATRIAAILTDYGNLSQPTTSEVLEALDCGIEEAASLLSLAGEDVDGAIGGGGRGNRVGGRGDRGV